MLGIDERFSNKQELIHAVHTFSIEQRVEIETLFSDKTQYTVKCRDSDCNWRLNESVSLIGV